MANEEKKSNMWTWLAGIETRNILAFGVTVITLLLIWSLSKTIIELSDNQSNSAAAVFNALLPLLGTWVGTILAYYFSKENFEAANRAVTELAKTMTSDDKLKATRIKDKMIPFSQMFYKMLPANGIKLMKLIEELDKEKKGSRVPILTDKHYPAFVIHRSAIDRFLAQNAIANIDDVKAKLEGLKLNDLLDEASLKQWTERSFAVVALEGNLVQAKAAMEAIPYCQDVFVTQNGTKDESVLGWITNVIVEQNSKV